MSADELPDSQMWRELKKYFAEKHGGKFPGFAKISWMQIYEAMEQLGYPLNREQLKMMGR